MVNNLAILDSVLNVIAINAKLSQCDAAWWQFCSCLHHSVIRFQVWRRRIDFRFILGKVRLDLRIGVGELDYLLYIRLEIEVVVLDLRWKSEVRSYSWS